MKVLKQCCILRHKFQNTENKYTFWNGSLKTILHQNNVEIQRRIQIFGIGPSERVQKFQVQAFGYSHIEKRTSNQKPWNKDPLTIYISYPLHFKAGPITWTEEDQIINMKSRSSKGRQIYILRVGKSRLL